MLYRLSYAHQDYSIFTLGHRAVRARRESNPRPAA